MKVLLVLSLFVAWSAAQVTQFVGEIPVTNVDLINLFNHTNPANNRQRFSILAGTYSTERATRDPSVLLLYPGNHMPNNFSGFVPSNVFNFLYWPKEVQQIPRTVFGNDAVLNPDGSTLLQKTEGALYVTDMSNLNFPATHDITAGRLPIPENIMYHSGVWFDIYVGSRLDLVTCRVEIEGGVFKRAQLVSLQHPSDGFRGLWSLDVIRDSACDTNLAYAFFRQGVLNNFDVVYATGFHTQRLTMYWSEGTSWNQANQMQARVIDQGRQFYDVVVFDINRNGNPNLLVTSVAQNGGVVEVWDIPNDFRTVGQYVRRVIASGFTSRNGGVNGRTPKVARPFYPTNNLARKPWIMVAGGDDGRAYYLRPQSEVATNWAYTLITVVDHGPNQEVGGMTAADIDGDGFTELFVSVRNKNVVQVFSFRAELDEFVLTNNIKKAE